MTAVCVSLEPLEFEDTQPLRPLALDLMSSRLHSLYIT